MEENIKVVCLDTGEIFDDISDASWAMSVFMVDILKYCKGIPSHTFGTHWDFYENLI